MKSILQDKKECFVTRRIDNLQEHHIFAGSRRKLSEKYGLKVWLIMDYHTGEFGVHTHPDFDLQLKMTAQKAFEVDHSRAEFIRLFGRSYL